MQNLASPVNQKLLDEHYMRRALELAKQASVLGEVPVGALIVLEREPVTGVFLAEPEIISESHNNRETQTNPLGHAEVLAIGKAATKLGRWRLSGCSLYVTLEPCLMCAGACVLSRVGRVIYGAFDPKAGAVRSLYKTLEDVRLNHRPEVLGGVLEDECAALLRNFFSEKRKK